MSLQGIQIMLIGVPKEIKDNEYRVGLTPDSVRELVSAGHEVLIEENAGSSIGYADHHYMKAGAYLAKTAQEVFATAELIVKVKEPQPDECRQLSDDQILFTYLHLAADPLQAKLLMESGVTAIAYETVTDKNGRLPLLAPMSEIAGRMSIQVGAVALQKAGGGSGVLLGGVPGVLPGKVLILGGGVVGLNAARMAIGLGADVTVFDKYQPRLIEIDNMFEGRIKTCYGTLTAIDAALPDADLVVGAALITGAAAPELVCREQLAKMKPGSVLVDVSIDQGGCFETSHPTTHSDPTFIVDGIVHYCVANMPGAVAKTSTQALNNATLPYVLALAKDGIKVLSIDPGFRAGLNVQYGAVTHRVVAETLGLPHTINKVN
jgi:alanine dehydrogenase